MINARISTEDTDRKARIWCRADEQMDANTKTNHVLIDFENVQPTNLTLLLDRVSRVYVFVGENQTKIPFALVEAMQELGDAGKYVKI